MEIGARRGATLRFVVSRFAVGRSLLAGDRVLVVAVRTRAGRGLAVTGRLLVILFRVADDLVAFITARLAPSGLPKFSGGETTGERRTTQRES